MKKKIVLLITFMVISLGCVSKDKLQTNEDRDLQTVTEDPYDWCAPGDIINSSNESYTGFIIKGMTEYQGEDMCEAEWKYEGGSVTELFTEDGNTTMIYKDINGNVIINDANEQDETVSDTGEAVTNETVNNMTEENETATNGTITNIAVYIPKGVGTHV